MYIFKAFLMIQYTFYNVCQDYEQVDIWHYINASDNSNHTLW